MEAVYLVLESADDIIVGTPAYYDSISAQLKLVVDRSNCLTEIIRLPDGKVTFQSRLEKRKRGVFVWVADFSRNPEHALAMIRLWFKDANTLIAINSDKREDRNQEDLLQKAFQLGVSLGRSL